MSYLTEELTSLKKLLDQGIITQEEFDAKKAQILSAPVAGIYEQQPFQGYGDAPKDEGSTGGWAVLGFFFPIVGLILYLVWRDTKPLSAKAAGRGALIGFVVGVLLYVFSAAVLSFSFVR